MNNKKLLIADKIKIKIEDSIILDNTSFDVERWEIVSIIWENWVWKTTLLKTILWEIKINSWKLKILASKISYVPQKLNIDKTLPITSLDFIKLFNNNLDDNYIIKQFSNYNYNNLLNKKISNLSWWEFQKIIILNALINSPDLVLMDEPTSSIDETGQERFYNILSEIITKNKDIAFLIVSHNKEHVFAYSDKILHLHKECSCINKLEKNYNKNKKNNTNNLVEYNHIHDHDHHEKN